MDTARPRRDPKSSSFGSGEAGYVGNADVARCVPAVQFGQSTGRTRVPPRRTACRLSGSRSSAPGIDGAIRVVEIRVEIDAGVSAGCETIKATLVVRVPPPCSAIFFLLPE